MPRINLTISEELLDALRIESSKQNIPVNLLAVETLERLFLQKPVVDYVQFTKSLLEEVDELPKDKVFFTLSELPTYREIETSKISEGKIKPSAMRARIGKAFNELVRTGGAKGISRAYTTNKDGEKVLRFDHRSAVYAIDWSLRESA